MNLLISFSGGETSGMMTQKVLSAWNLDGIDRYFHYDKVIVAFANTGEENEQTLEFVNECDKKFKFGTVWVEAVVHPDKGQGTTCRIVDFHSASRNGEPYEAVIKKYGIPNAKFLHCTRELKEKPIMDLIRNRLGWKRGEYHIAIGIRADESERRAKNAVAASFVYPFLDWLPQTKADVNQFWEHQPFRLRLAGYQGNCKWCWKKSDRKLLQIMDETPRVFDFPDRMEKQYGRVGAEFQKTVAPGYRRTFFRGNRSVEDLRQLVTSNWADPSVKGLDDGGGCVESCELTFDQASMSLDVGVDEPVEMVHGEEK